MMRGINAIKSGHNGIATMEWLEVKFREEEALSGNANPTGIGSDLDGAFGREQCPYDLKTIADLQKLSVLLEKRGYLASDIEKIMSGNFLNFLGKNLPD